MLALAVQRASVRVRVQAPELVSELERVLALGLGPRLDLRAPSFSRAAAGPSCLRAAVASSSLRHLPALAESSSLPALAESSWHPARREGPSSQAMAGRQASSLAAGLSCLRAAAASSSLHRLRGSAESSWHLARRVDPFSWGWEGRPSSSALAAAASSPTSKAVRKIRTVETSCPRTRAKPRRWLVVRQTAGPCGANTDGSERLECRELTASRAAAA